MQFELAVELILYTVCPIIVVGSKALLALTMVRNGKSSQIRITVFLLINGRKIWLKLNELFCDLTQIIVVLCLTM
jgi:hypothetical protein